MLPGVAPRFGTLEERENFFIGACVKLAVESRRKSGLLFIRR